ncbi:MAG: helix-turn-helix domain-containing protein [Alphaproteobacteria bacterium]|nr:helix-turn-helix domain-containing protein [Alphaproteobacteria bacterium]
MTKQDIDSYVGKRLRLRRTMMGLSQEAVAKAVGITFQQVQKYEKGVNAMNARRLVEFSRFMNVPVAYFFDGLEESEAAGSENTLPGFAETAEAFDHGSPVSDRESLEMMKAFKRIGEHGVRKRLSDLVRAIAENKTMLD